MKKLFAIFIAALFSLTAFAQTYPSPTFNNVTLQNPLTAANGGTGATSSTGTGSVVLSNVPTLTNPAITGGTITGLSSPLPVLSGGTGATTSTGSGANVLNTSPTLVTPALGTPSALVLTNATGTPTSLGLANATGLPAATGITGVLPSANGGTVLPSITEFDPLCGTGTHDCTAGINAAIAAGKGGVVFPPGIYYDTGSHTISANGFQFVGSGQSTYGVGSFTGAGTLIVETTAANPFLTIANAATWVAIKNFTVTRNVTATSGGNGIVFAGDTEFSFIENVMIDSQFTGLSLNTTTFSTINRVIVQNSRADGVDMTDTSTNGTVQWQIHHLISSSNVGRGISISGVSGTAGMILGAWDDIQTFANTGGGIGVAGVSGSPVFDLRINGCFLGSDGNNSEIGMSFAKNVMISFCFIERAGLDPTGPGGATPASNAGNGISIDSNSSEVMIKDSYINNNAYNGIFSSATNLTLVGLDVTNNGQALSAGNRTGVVINTGTASITSVRSSNVGGNTSQQFGIANGGTIDVSVGNNLKPNATGTYNGTAATIGGAALNNQ